MNKLEEKFNQEVLPQLMKEFGYKNQMEAPGIDKVSINVGLSRAVRGEQNFTQDVVHDLKLITGQAPVITQAKKAIAGFKIRAGQEVGALVTLRGTRKWDFVYRLLSVTIPRIRDFQGIKPSNFDGQGNLSLGIKEQLFFLEISPDEVNSIFSLQVNLATGTKTKEEGVRMFQLLGFPFEKVE